jgi:hypothetical protein
MNLNTTAIRDWHVDDAEWHKSRKKQWRYVKKSVEQAYYLKIDRQDMKTLKAYFLTGEINDLVAFKKIFCVAHPIIRMWFHPNDDESIYEKFWEGEIDSHVHSRAEDFIRDNFKYLEPYWMMGGKEKSIARYLMPSKYSPGGICDRSQLKPHRFIQNFTTSVSSVLRPKLVAPNIYRPALFLFDYFVSCSQQPEGEFPLRELYAENAISSLLDFEKNIREIPEIAHEQAYRVRRKMTKLLKDGSIQGVLQDKWQEMS